jgi:hypothetical protein
MDGALPYTWKLYFSRFDGWGGLTEFGLATFWNGNGLLPTPAYNQWHQVESLMAWIQGREAEYHPDLGNPEFPKPATSALQAKASWHLAYMDLRAVIYLPVLTRDLTVSLSSLAKYV